VRKIIPVALALALLVAVPAFGAPSPLAIAKKALRIASGTKKELKRSYNRTHPTEVVLVDGGDRTALPLNFVTWELDCPRGTVAVGTGIGYGALEPVSDLTYGSGTIVSLFNPSSSSAFSGSVVLSCVWAAESNTARVAGAPSKRAAWRKVRSSQRDLKSRLGLP
jgi:hypothetical protein